MSPREEHPGTGTRPFLQVVKGDPSPEEVAALVAVLTARARAAQAARAAAERAATPVSAWRDRSRLVRRPLRPGPGAWRSAFHPG
ncbi:acyl-CoA carboxylase subunit epsilon [Marinactinospora thermotolerans]|uniref:Acyl-CoA carboxylase epsilon subunit n=1 Tax=Marinactinospora thermotolerans DSM 45154 TaxID=1122192 RepID=A0A1T4QQK7_9ACTN|nr:acyl-CoA carboxylase subunit epsilon [Marinactinospora thermotolerans]SKA05538.1 Acyl-CoA carboxylase epsilon subunit [Marinactinospora thermotolerans DSM 45154]